MNTSAKYKIAAMSLGAAVLVFLVWYFHVIVFYVLAAAVISLLGKPVVGLLMKLNIGRWSIPKWVAAAVTLLGILAGIAALFVIFIPIVVDKFSFIASVSPERLNEMLSIPLQNTEHWIDTSDPTTFCMTAELSSGSIRSLARGL